MEERVYRLNCILLEKHKDGNKELLQPVQFRKRHPYLFHYEHRNAPDSQRRSRHAWR